MKFSNIYITTFLYAAFSFSVIEHLNILISLAAWLAFILSVRGSVDEVIFNLGILKRNKAKRNIKKKFINLI